MSLVPLLGLNRVVRSTVAKVTIILFIHTASHPAFKTHIPLTAWWVDLVRIDRKLRTAIPMNYFLRHMDELNPASCRFLVHYKAAVRERQRMRLFMTYWELEETNRLRTLLMSLSAEEDLEFRGAERDTQGLLKVLVTEQSLSRTAADVDFLTAVRQRNKTSLRETDAQLDLLEERITQMHRVRSSADGLDNTVGSSPITTDA
ncbi:uncharacterized protein F5147DRAFT_677216 [Suillus discolor]|uniref:Uncharacterized protein n=1 Tax=Suillus discolor TaxID=1912936 RepID=A0A9P7JX47_9AGAM|nr:uncharacterized protein F5147DRAFT_677216 [Suillus discolor]KAG2114565.1 hypothetical protein F5147DRAFT_677216 [Suillus discolor]